MAIPTFMEKEVPSYNIPSRTLEHQEIILLPARGGKGKQSRGKGHTQRHGVKSVWHMMNTIKAQDMKRSVRRERKRSGRFLTLLASVASSFRPWGVIARFYGSQYYQNFHSRKTMLSDMKEKLQEIRDRGLYEVTVAVTGYHRLSSYTKHIHYLTVSTGQKRT